MTATLKLTHGRCNVELQGRLRHGRQNIRRATAWDPNKEGCTGSQNGGSRCETWKDVAIYNPCCHPANKVDRKKR